MTGTEGMSVRVMTRTEGLSVRVIPGHLLTRRYGFIEIRGHPDPSSSSRSRNGLSPPECGQPAIRAFANENR
jgi:hypothetical protein